MRSLILLLALWSATQAAVAQSSSRPDPTDPAAPAPAIQPQSAFADYQPFQEQKSNSWKQVNKEVADNPGMGSMKDMPGKTMSETDKGPNAPPMQHDGDGGTTMTTRQTDSDHAADARTSAITGTGVVRSIDRVNGKVQLTHDPIDALGWPKMTMSFRLKDSALADQVKEGDKVDFSLEKSASGYVISGFRKSAAGHDMKQMK